MGRPYNKRKVAHPPIWQHFKPERKSSKGEIILHLDELEAIRLSDYLGYTHKKSVKIMEISRSTFTRLIGGAHKKLGGSVTTGKEIFINGGNVCFENDILVCRNCGSTISFDFGTSLPVGCPDCGEKNVYFLSERFVEETKNNNKKEI